MSKETAEYVNRIRNTYYYTIESDQGIPSDDLGDFSMLIPPFPYPEHQGSQLGIFKVKSFYICAQTDSNRIPSNYNDSSGFYVIISGLGIRGQCFLNTKSVSLKPQRAFFVPNKYGDGALAESKIYNRLSGSSHLDVECLCSNPAGTTLRVEVVDADTGAKVVNNTNLYAMLEFSIELVSSEISNGS